MRHHHCIPWSNHTLWVLVASCSFQSSTTPQDICNSVAANCTPSWVCNLEYAMHECKITCCCHQDVAKQASHQHQSEPQHQEKKCAGSPERPMPKCSQAVWDTRNGGVVQVQLPSFTRRAIGALFVVRRDGLSGIRACRQVCNGHNQRRCHDCLCTTAYAH